PGVTIRPSASISWAPRSSTRPTSTMTPSRTATSAVRGGAPLPSTTVPPRRTRSIVLPHLSVAGGRYRPARRARGPVCRPDGGAATWVGEGRVGGSVVDVLREVVRLADLL